MLVRGYDYIRLPYSVDDEITPPPVTKFLGSFLNNVSNKGSTHTPKMVALEKCRDVSFHGRIAPQSGKYLEGVCCLMTRVISLILLHVCELITRVIVIITRVMVLFGNSAGRLQCTGQARQRCRLTLGSRNLSHDVGF